MGTGIVYSQKTYNKEELKKQLETNTQILDLIEKIISKIDLPSLSIYLRESLTKLFKEYEYLKTVHTLNSTSIGADDIVIELLNENNILTKIFISFRINTNLKVILDNTKDMIGKEVFILNNLKILIFESKIVPNNHYNRYAIYLNIYDLINHTKV